MQQIRTADDIKQLGTILSVGAHPDDESFTAAGILATAVKNGQKVICLTATRGELGVQDEERWPAAELGEIRQKELKQALEILGVNSHILLDYRDGECHKVPLEEGASHLVLAIQEHQPDTIITFGPDGLTGHTDHKSVSKWAAEAVNKSGQNIKIYQVVEEENHYKQQSAAVDKQFNIFFNIDKPPLRSTEQCDIYYQLPPEILKIKKAALLAQASQMDKMFNQTPAETLDAMLGLECFVLAD